MATVELYAAILDIGNDEALARFSGFRREDGINIPENRYQAGARTATDLKISWTTPIIAQLLDDQLFTLFFPFFSWMSSSDFSPVHWMRENALKLLYRVCYRSVVNRNRGF